MSVGDVKGSRRRFKQRQQLGHAARPARLSVGEAIAKNRAAAARADKAKKK